MILGKLWRALKAQVNKPANWLRGRDPIAEMQLECDLAAESMKEGRRGLEQYRMLVERVGRQVSSNRKQAEEQAVKIRTFLASGDRAAAGQLALEHQHTVQQVQENEAQLKLHEEAYQNNLKKLQYASRRIADARHKVAGYDAALRMSKAEAEVAKLAQALQFDVTTDFGQVEQVIQEQIDQQRAAVRVAADLSSQGMEEVRQQEQLDHQRAEDALRQFEEQPQQLVYREKEQA